MRCRLRYDVIIALTLVYLGIYLFDSSRHQFLPPNSPIRRTVPIYQLLYCASGTATIMVL